MELLHFTCYIDINVVYEYWYIYYNICSKIIRRSGAMKERSGNVKRDRFVRIAEGRTTVILNALESLGRCANKHNYEYSESDVKEIFGEINSKLREVKALFQEGPRGSNRFKLGGRKHRNGA
jgi:hypothetical protein